MNRDGKSWGDIYPTCECDRKRVFCIRDPIGSNLPTLPAFGLHGLQLLLVVSPPQPFAIEESRRMIELCFSLIIKMNSDLSVLEAQIVH